MQRLGHIPALDGLRGVAILLVLLSHAGHLRGGGMVGVYLFFALSGFLITGLLLTEHERGVIRLGGFYRRRALRLLPALTLLLVVFGVVAVRAGEWVDGLVTLALGLSYSMNIAVAAGYDPGGFVHLWSLALEEQFYLVWPPLLVLLLAKRSPAVIGSGLAVAAVGFAVWRGYLEASGVTGPRLWWSPDTNAVPLLAGCCAAFAYTYLPKVPAYVGLLALPVPVLMVDWWWVPGYGLTTTLPAVAFAVLTLAVAGNGFRPLEFPPLRAVGKVSYGLYLWHLPLFLAFGWKLGLLSAVALALLSWRYVEQPFLRRRRRLAEVARPAPLNAVPPPVPA